MEIRLPSWYIVCVLDSLLNMFMNPKSTISLLIMYYFFQVKVMLRVSDPTGASPGESSCSNSFFSLDKRKKQVTLIDPSSCGGSAAPEDRRVGVAAPKMFAFDAIFSQDDSQVRYRFFLYVMMRKNLKKNHLILPPQCNE